MLHNQLMERVSSYKYLGVIICDDLSWSPHIDRITSKTRQLIGMLYRRFYKWSSSRALLQLQGRIQDFLGGGSLLGCACALIQDHAHFWKTTPTNGQQVPLHGDKPLENQENSIFQVILVRFSTEYLSDM